MKKIKLAAIAVMLAFLVTIPGFVHADETVVTPNKLIVFKVGDLNYYVQKAGSEEFIKTPMDVAPEIKHDRTFVPVRYLGYALGLTENDIHWDAATRIATLEGKVELQLKIEEKTITTNGKKEVIDVAPYITDGRTMLPARYVAEGLGFKVDWDENNRLVMVYPEGHSKPDLTVIKTRMGIQVPVSTVIQGLGSSSGVQDVKVDGYAIKVGNHPDDPTMFISIGDGSRPPQRIRVVCTSHPEFNQCKWSRPDGTWKERSQDVWTNDYMLFREGYSSNPKSGMTVTFDIYGSYNGDKNYTGEKIATIQKILP